MVVASQALQTNNHTQMKIVQKLSCVKNNQTGLLKLSYQLNEDLLREVEMVHVSGLGVYDL